MEEKNKIKIKFTTIIITILVLIIVGVTFFTTKIYIENKERKAEIERLNNKIENLVINSKTEIIKPEKVEETKTAEEVKTIKLKDIIGTYRADVKTGTTDDAIYILNLFENGTFHYTYSTFAEQGIIGNYIFDEDTKEIILNILYEHGSDIAMNANTKVIKLKLNEDKTIQDTNELIKQSELNGSKVKLNNIKLTKKRNNTKDDITVEYMINNFYAHNNVQK